MICRYSGNFSNSFAHRQGGYLWVGKHNLDWWRRVDSNHGPTDYETVALAT
jgi:hypothetical protein